MGVWRRREFDFPDITLSISDIIRNSIAYWQSEIKTSGCSHPKGKSHFVNFLAILIRGMIFRPMNVPAKYKGGPITYEYVFGDDEAAKFRATFPKAIRYPVGNWNNPFQICRSINWSLAIVRLAKILQEGNYFKKVVLITETRPSQKVQVTLRDFCGSQ